MGVPLAGLHEPRTFHPKNFPSKNVRGPLGHVCNDRALEGLES